MTPSDDDDRELSPTPSTPAIVRRAMPLVIAAAIGGAGCTSDPGEPLHDSGPVVLDAGISVQDAGPGTSDAGIVDAGPPVADAGIAPPTDGG